MSPRTVYDLLAHAAAKYRDLPALHQPIPGGKGDTKYRTYSFVDYREAVDELAAGLHTLGIRKGDFLAISSETRAEFYLADFAGMTVGAIVAALYTSYSFAQQAKTLDSLLPRLVFAENPKALEALRSNAERAAEMQWVLLTGEHPDALSLAALREKGRVALAADPQLVANLNAAVSPKDEAMLYMTSGATGEPKMGLVSQGAIVYNVHEMAVKVLHLTPQDRTIVFLPSAHITQRLALEILPLEYGMPIWFSESLSRFPHELKSIKPTFLVAPPRVWERVYSRISTEIQKKPTAVRRMIEGAIGAGSKAARLRERE